LLSGIAWDHINVFPTFENYVEQFTIFIDLITEGGSLIYCDEDEHLSKICPVRRPDVSKHPYSLPAWSVAEGTTIIHHVGKDYPLLIFGKHNLLNLNGARLVCNELGITDEQFYTAIRTFKGASKRLELVAKNASTAIYKDFAHSPSKLEATIRAVKEQYPEKQLVACMELHTYSSLSLDFLSHYKGCMDQADIPIVYYNPHAIMLKKLPFISSMQIREGFANEKLETFQDSKLLYERLLQEDWNGKNLLLMSSGDFDGLDMKELAAKMKVL
jgi:UDP-N-acetylmuramate: L-alanyl-gamma-D-glutamyl-meso-diaminopimelate ligase